jgi:hypothetical protein
MAKGKGRTSNDQKSDAHNKGSAEHKAAQDNRSQQIQKAKVAEEEEDDD